MKLSHRLLPIQMTLSVHWLMIDKNPGLEAVKFFLTLEGDRQFDVDVDHC